MVHFSNAIACDQSIDFHMDDGDAWEDTVCVSAFDGLHPDEPANMTKFDIIDIGAKLHQHRRDRLQKLREQDKLEKASLIAEKNAALGRAQKGLSPGIESSEDDASDESGGTRDSSSRKGSKHDNFVKNRIRWQSSREGTGSEQLGRR